MHSPPDYPDLIEASININMALYAPPDRTRISYSQASSLQPYQLQPPPPRPTQPPITSAFSYPPPELPHPEAISTLTQGNSSGPIPRDNTVPLTQSQENAYILQLQEASHPPHPTHSLASSHPPQVHSAPQPHSNGERPEALGSQPPANPSIQNPSLEIAQMTRPPEGVYPTFEALLRAANQHAFAHGYAFVIGRSKKKNKLGLKKVLLSCDKGGTSHHKMLPLDSEHRKRKTTSRKTGCEFGVYAVESQTEWTLKYRPDPACSLHNHGPSKNVTDHPAARKLNSSAIAAVKAMKDAGVSAQDTLKEIQREQPGTLLIARDVYNARAALRRDPERVIDPAIATSNPPLIYRRATMTPEERLRDDLRMEVKKAQEELERTKEDFRKEIDTLKATLKEKEKLIEKFEMFIDICNQRVMVQRERLTDEGEPGGGSA